MIDTAGLHRLVPNPKTVTYYVATPSGYNAGVMIERAESRAMKFEEMQLVGGAGASASRTWHVWTELLSGITPNNGDYLVDNKTGDQWVVKLAVVELNDARWRLLTVLQR